MRGNFFSFRFCFAPQYMRTSRFFLLPPLSGSIVGMAEAMIKMQNAKKRSAPSTNTPSAKRTKQTVVQKMGTLPFLEQLEVKGKEAIILLLGLKKKMDGVLALLPERHGDVDVKQALKDYFMAYNYALRNTRTVVNGISKVAKHEKAAKKEADGK